MDNTLLILFLKDVRAGKVLHLDQDTLDMYGLADNVYRISNDELCERLIAEHDRSQQILTQADKRLVQLDAERRQQLDKLTSEMADVTARNSELTQCSLRWKNFFLGWSICSIVLLLLTLLGPDLDGFAAGWLLSMASVAIAPKLKSAYRVAKVIGRVGHRLIFP